MDLWTLWTCGPVDSVNLWTLWTLWTCGLCGPVDSVDLWTRGPVDSVDLWTLWTFVLEGTDLLSYFVGLLPFETMSVMTYVMTYTVLRYLQKQPKSFRMT